MSDPSYVEFTQEKDPARQLAMLAQAYFGKEDPGSDWHEPLGARNFLRLAREVLLDPPPGVPGDWDESMGYD